MSKLAILSAVTFCVLHNETIVAKLFVTSRILCKYNKIWKSNFIFYIIYKSILVMSRKEWSPKLRRVMTDGKEKR